MRLAAKIDMTATLIQRETRPARRREPKPATSRASAAGRRDWFANSALAPALASAALSWAAFPPLDWWPLAWLAPLGWLWLCGRPVLPGRRPWLAIWFSGFVFWLGLLHFLRLPHPATCLGWVALSFYFAFYTPAFVWLAREALHRWRIPLVVAAPMVWMGLELARGHLLTGHTFGDLGYTQYRWLALLQTADIWGVYGVSAVVVLVAAAIATWLPGNSRPARIGSSAAAAVLLLGVAGYGHWRLADRGQLRPGPRAALIQGSIDTHVKADPEQRDVVYEQYVGLSDKAVREVAGVELLIWPETMFRDSLITIGDDFQPPADVDWNADDARYTAERNERFIGSVVRSFGVPVILGIDRQHLGPGKINRYNAALYVDRQGQIVAEYDKMHPVMFGEYIPLGKLFPWLYKITPLAGGLTPGAEPKSFEIAGARFGPSICFENILPHLLRDQVRRLRAVGQEPDVLVNLTNDGWFYGSSELDLHLVCGVFRAVESRKPMLIAANTGFSASIDSAGRIVTRGPRRDLGIVVADLVLDGRHSFYDRFGDLLALGCLLFCGALAIAAVATGVRNRRDPRFAKNSADSV